MNRILIVDDKEENLYYLQSLLEGSGFEVDTARHGAEALAKGRKHPPSIVVTDLLMPVMDGYTLLRRWKADSQLRRIPFIVYTATYTEPEDERLALRLGADAFILKPAEPEDFIARIRELGNRRETRPPSETKGNLEPNQKEVLEEYSETLIRKLEEKMLELEETNRKLHVDIEERKLAEERLKESDNRFRTLLKHIPSVAVQGYLLDGTVLYWNDASEKFYGYSSEEAVGKNLLDLIIPPEMQEECRKGLESMAENSAQLPAGELELMRKDGSRITVYSSHSLVKRPGKPTEFFCIDIDLSERKKLEEQFLRAQRLESIGTLAGGIAHDLNNLLSPIVMGVDLLRGLAPDPRAASIIDNISNSARRGTDLVKQVLSFARGVEGARVTIQIDDLLGEVEAIISNTFPKNILIERSTPPDLWTVKGDPTQLNQVILNLCVNSRDAMPRGGRLALSANNSVLDGEKAGPALGALKGSHVVIQVADEGCGMSKKVLDRVFEPFFTTKELGKGTGLGLSTALGIVQSHKGTITVESKPGEGSVFTICLPAENQANENAEAEQDSGVFRRGQGECILIVDDEVSILSITKQTLEAFGYRTLIAKDGKAALKLYQEKHSHIDVVFTDMMMPSMNGNALIEKVRAINPSQCIITTSGIDVGSDGLNNQPQDYFLAKPYSAEQLLKLLATALANFSLRKVPKNP